jgi:hypothetical protein
MRAAIVTTTIYVPQFLSKYAENLKAYGHHATFFVIADTKTPDEAKKFCEGIENCIYVDIPAQRAYLTKHGHTALMANLPYNSIARRNIGHLMAYEAGADVIVMLDDDNYATSQDVMLHHSVVGQAVSRHTYASTNGWFNVCGALKEINDVSFYARGYPPSKRWADGLVTTEVAQRTVAVNGGLWLNDPDIDALTRLERHLLVTGTSGKYPASFALHPGTWSPWNCQNTAISRAALASYFLSPYTGRHLDIWASYITTRIAEAMGEVITFGTPLAFHDRSPHNLYKDLEQELPWVRMTDEFVHALRVTEVKTTSYTDGLRQVIEGLEKNWKTFEPVKKDYLLGLRVWNEIFARIG